jgi:hypothetical protein
MASTVEAKLAVVLGMSIVSASVDDTPQLLSAEPGCP